MYNHQNFKQIDQETFLLQMQEDRDFKILQLTDLHLGFGLFSKKKDRQAMDAIRTLVERTQPDLMVLTGDSIFPYFPMSGTLNNRKEATLFLAFMDGFEIPYALVMGNHDTEVFSKCSRPELGEIFMTGKNAIFAAGPEDIYGVGNYMIELRRGDKLEKVLCLLDSNMYVTKSFFDGFDRIHPDQTAWCMAKLAKYREENAELEALAFYHMPVAEFKEAYEKMKLGDESVRYHFGTVSETHDYFGISRLPGDFFAKAKENGIIRYMFCGHDHVNNISLTYEGIRLTYGMSIDCLGYPGIDKHEVQRGATEIVIKSDTTKAQKSVESTNAQQSVEIRPVPLGAFVTKRVRGV